MVKTVEDEFVEVTLPDGTKHTFPVIILEDGDKAIDFSELEEKTGIKLS